jgi:oligoendopeptidase F
MASSSNVDLDVSKIPLYQPRHFVPGDIDLTETVEVSALYQKLAEKPINSWADMEAFLADWSELESVVSEHAVVLYIRMTCQTDDLVRSEAFRHFTQQVLPAIKPLEHRLETKLVSFYDTTAPPNDRYAVLIRNTRADIELFRQENVLLQKREDALIQDYQTVCGAMMVEFQGRQFTMPQMGHKLAEPDRALREAAWLAATQRRQQDAGRLDDIFDEMIALRHEIALNAGEPNYRDYKFKEWHRFDYTPDDCNRYHNAVIEIAVPAFGRILRHRQQVMHLDTMRPWDFSPVQPADPYGRAPLRPFTRVEELVSGVRNIVRRLHPDFDRLIADMDALGLLDLASRKGKAPGGYQESLEERRQQFIFGNVVGSNDDVYLLLHEGGHVFHAAACRDEPLMAYRRHAPIEFCEVASQGMELLGSRYLDEFYNAADARRAWRERLEDIVFGLIWVANVDAFQHWIYEHPREDRRWRHEAWVQINRRFFGQFYDWSGLSEYRATAWQRQLHIFQVPFYYIEYGIAQLGALGIWLQAQDNLDAAVNHYRAALALGGSKPLPELFAAAGLKFDFSVRTVGPLVEAVMNEWENVRNA